MQTTQPPTAQTTSIETVTADNPLANRRAYTCQCGRPVFFRNSQCLACGTPLGYEPGLGEVIPLQAATDGLWRRYGGDENDAPVYRRCANLESAAACNWLIATNASGAFDAVSGGSLCRSCRLNRTIPDLNDASNASLWGRVEVSKRRLVSALIGLGLPVDSRLDVDPTRGLAFDLLRPAPNSAAVMTGHADGIITLNVEEADDVSRERIRAALHEPYRTVLGHLRHEVGHYYWNRLIENGASHPAFRELFGDEREDYQGALQRHYTNGPAPDWWSNYVSAYASAHPWEDWAETWAHYMHMVDTLDTAASFNVSAASTDLQYEGFTAESLHASARDDTAFLGFVDEWIRLTGVLNELSRSMGQPDLYPFVLSSSAVTKLHFVHRVVRNKG